jgi:hypothetical protein
VSLYTDEFEGFRLFVLDFEAELDNLSNPLHQRIEGSGLGMAAAKSRH